MIDRGIVAGGYGYSMFILYLSYIYPIFIVYLWYVVVREQGGRSREGERRGSVKNICFVIVGWRFFMYADKIIKIEYILFV